MARPRLIVFLRAPRQGEVKTRLASGLGPDGALAAYCELLEATLRAVESLDNVELRYTPDDGVLDVIGLVRPGWSTLPQGPGDLGDRLERAFFEGFADDCDRIVVIGTDCPYLRSDDICRAWDLLKTHGVVIGPASDGGYWLIGLNQHRPQLFQDIPWGTSQVLAETLMQAERLGLQIAQLGQFPDVDTPADWDAYLRWKRSGDQLAQLPPCSPSR